MINDKKYYVYFLIDPRNNLPFYIGKGCNLRAFSHLKETYDNTENNKKLCKIKSIHGEGRHVIVSIIHENLDERTAYEKEEAYIGQFGRAGIDEFGILTNICKGNNPPNHTGKKYSKTHCDNIRKAKLNQSKETRTKISISLKGKKKSKEHISAIKLSRSKQKMKCKPVFCQELNLYFKSSKHAVEFLGKADFGKINRAARKYCKKAYGLTWFYS